MAKLHKKLKKGVKRLDKKVINNKKGLTLTQTFDITTSFYGRKKVKKPYITLTAHGDYKISVVKLVLCLFLGIALITMAVLCLRALFVRKRTKKRRPADVNYGTDGFDKINFDDIDEEEEMPF